MAVVPSASEPTGKLGPQDWVSAPETQAVIKALMADGAEVRFVGGCVRDALAKRPVNDIDIATADAPDTVVALLERAGLKAVPTGIDHGTITAVSGNRSFEITTLRRDVETDGRRARVAFTDDWVEDAARRDFTINTLSATPDGDVYDPYDGIHDLAHGRVRFVGLAHERVDEDYLRILRFFRFYGVYGRPPINKDALAACRSRANKVAELSGERVRTELMKILMVADPADIILRMRGEGVLDYVLPEAGEPGPLRLVNWLETRAVNIEGVAPDAIRHLAALITTDEISPIAKRLRLSNLEAERLTTLRLPPVKIDAEMGAAAEKRYIRRHGASLVRDLAILNWARELDGGPRLPRQRTDAWIALLERCRDWLPPEFPIAGADVMAAGIEEGPAVGEFLRRLESWWENGDYKASRQQCLDRLAVLVRDDKKELLE